MCAHTFFSCGDWEGTKGEALDNSRGVQLVGQFVLLAASDAKSDGEDCNESNAEFCYTSSAPSDLNFQENQTLKVGVK